jgi:hypothetical protein
MESDEEIRRVPEVGLELAGPSTSGREATAAAGTAAGAAGTSSASQAATSAARRRGRSPADKEHRRLKRCVAFSRLFVAGSVASFSCCFLLVYGIRSRRTCSYSETVVKTPRAFVLV